LATILGTTEMSFKICHILCALATLFLIASPVAAEAWIIQSLTQDLDYTNDRVFQQNSIQISGSNGGDLFQIQQLNQKQGMIDPDEIEASFVMQRDGVAVQGISAADLIEIMKDISSRDDMKGSGSCGMDIHFFDCLPYEMQMDSEDELQEIDINSSREAVARLDLILARSWHDLWNAPDDGYYALLLSNSASRSFAPGFPLVGEID